MEEPPVFCCLQQDIEYPTEKLCDISSQCQVSARVVRLLLSGHGKQEVTGIPCLCDAHFATLEAKWKQHTTQCLLHVGGTVTSTHVAP
jgi:hypothetical protein